MASQPSTPSGWVVGVDVGQSAFMSTGHASARCVHSARYSPLLVLFVGTSSARAGVIDIATGHMLASHSHPILIFHPRPNFYQHSSSDIWAAVCTAVTSALRLAQQRSPAFHPSAVKGLAFDATCSLVLLGEDDAPVTVSPGGEAEQNVIVWMDHRAEAETAAINATSHEVLRFVGGGLSVEMEIPKLLWLRTHLPESFKAATRFLDLADFLSYKATGTDGQRTVGRVEWGQCGCRSSGRGVGVLTASDAGASVRSLCCVTCKWTHLAHLHGDAPTSPLTTPADVADFEHGQRTATNRCVGFHHSRPVLTLLSRCPYFARSGWSKSFFQQIGLVSATLLPPRATVVRPLSSPRTVHCRRFRRWSYAL